jgi:hypothetical protein
MTARRLATTLRLAQVGWTGSNADKARIDQARHWMRQNASGQTQAIDEVTDVKFDLSYQGEPHPLYGCDFLTDERRFAIVVLHHLFVGWTDSEAKTKPAIAEHRYFSCSPQHSEDAWRTRLRATGAQHIFSFGGTSEIGAAFLREIVGYRQVVTPFGAVYEKTQCRGR